MNKCAECANWRLKEAKEMAKNGFGLCSKLPKWRFKSPEATCPGFTLADAATIAARAKWLKVKHD